MLHLRRRVLVALATCSTVLTLNACAEPPPSDRVVVHSPTTQNPPTTRVVAKESPVLSKELSKQMSAENQLRAVGEFVDGAIRFAVLDERNKNAAGAERKGQLQSGPHVPGAPHPTTPAATPSIAAVMDCIKRHESGDYTEHSHIGSGSGAYQYIPGTWRVWSARAGYGGWQYAYLAPAAVQDAVTAYTLQNGGAGNWSNRFGNDPCTASLPGGG